MSENFPIPTTDATRKIVAETTTGKVYGEFENMKAALRDHLGLPRPADETFSMPPAPTPQAAPLPAQAQQGNPTFEEVIYPSGNDRYLVTGFSQAEVDQKIAAIKAALGVQ